MSTAVFRKLVAIVALCGMVNSVSAYELLGAKWATNTMKFNHDFKLNGNSLSPSNRSWNQAFVDAADAWNSQVNFNIVTDDSNPSHPCAGVGSYPVDGFRNGAAFHHELCFQGQDAYAESFGDNVLAVTISYSFTDALDEIIETDMFFNDAEGWDIYDGALKPLFDFARVVKHEMGHVLGLDHESVNNALMQPTVSNLYTLQPDDIAGATALYGPLSGRAPIVMNIDEPFDGSVQSGISIFRGWVVSSYELSSLKLYINGSYHSDLDHNGPRRDLCAVYGDYPDCGKSGFAFTYSYSNFPQEYNTFRVVAIDAIGNVQEQSVNFRVTRFDEPWVTDDKVSIANAAVSINGAEEIVLDNMIHDGKRYKVYLKWKRQRQGFEFTDIVRK